VFGSGKLLIFDALEGGMMNLGLGYVIDHLSATPSGSPIKRLLRTPLNLLPPGLQVTIVHGPLQGKRWIVGSSIHACWYGTYEQAESSLMKQKLRPGSIFFDIGAQAGYHTMYASSLVGPAGRVYAFEPAPTNLAYLKKHLLMNQLNNTFVVDAAVSDVNGVSHFDCADSPVAGHLSATGTLAVRTISLDQEIDSGALPEPDYIKIDAEGAELKILKGAQKMLSRRHPILSVETHQWLPQFSSIRQDCIRLLLELGYQVSEADPAVKHGDTHLCAFV
jgi:FkbM family methyltransferase